MESKPKFSIKIKVMFLVLLLFTLGGVALAAWVTDEYDRARNETIQEIKESGGTIDREEEIEFNVNEPEDDSLNQLNILLVGVDDDDGTARTDTIMIGRYAPDEEEVKLVSIMRDTYVDIPGRGYNKINAAFAFGGLDLLRETIEKNFDLEIQHYAQVNFDSFRRVVDTVAPDGIEIDIENRMYYAEQATDFEIDFQPGTHIMDGSDALKYVRFRNDSDNDFGRVQRQQELLSILQSEILSLSGVTRIPSVLGSVEPYIQTNISNSEMISYGRDFFLNAPDEIETLTIPVENGFSHEYYSHAGAVLELDMEKNAEALQKFLKGESSQVSVREESVGGDANERNLN
ncbi:LCP family protein [Salisediminibacterium selenitireducens]|uniref:Regulatory protein MsrR n=1 Tax=Bacillus selenitireducens (strain ATCC 700615 / DSM 15326 / MLS10) TaxID=439292 RepID=D6XTB5_BACIE|nr:LCP family protein [Salisediminibacterium selenitireducens]ADH99051.1 cell envelope-related transcriptional attenuator [[Bacillus] selenitireducens MLS10]